MTGGWYRRCGSLVFSPDSRGGGFQALCLRDRARLLLLSFADGALQIQERAPGVWMPAGYQGLVASKTGAS
jgi:hypothetical protein